MIQAGWGIHWGNLAFWSAMVGGPIVLVIVVVYLSKVRRNG